MDKSDTTYARESTGGRTRKERLGEGKKRKRKPVAADSFPGHHEMGKAKREVVRGDDSLNLSFFKIRLEQTVKFDER